MNEELQSTNEELETSKEELQSFNEELHSVNNQLQHKIDELDQTSNDLANLLSGTEIATVFLDTELRIKWFSPVTKQLLELQSSDIGRPLSHFAPKFADDQLLSDAEIVLAKLAPIDAEIRSDDGKWISATFCPTGRGTIGSPGSSSPS
jgi:two-component system CheB/CheR fusion protein